LFLSIFMPVLRLSTPQKVKGYFKQGGKILKTFFLVCL
jgi:hypothetical protein